MASSESPFGSSLGLFKDTAGPCCTMQAWCWRSVHLTLSAATSAALPGPPNEIRANRKAERHFEKLNDKFGTAHREILSRRSPDLAARRLLLTASSLQQHFTCRHQFTATQRSDDDGLVRLRKDTKRVGVSVSTLRLPVVHTKDGAIIERPGDLITFPVAVA